jgi:DNA repair protein RecO (recombination protein O)
MEQWTDQGIVLSVRPHGEGGAVVALLTEGHGRHAGFVHGGQSSQKRAMLQAGTVVKASWQARTNDQLGHYTLEADQSLSSDILQNSLKLSALLSACSLCDAALPEREGHAGLYHGLIALMEAMAKDHWEAAYIMWEIQLLRELGFRLELDKCAGGGDAAELCYVSPKTGRAVSKAQGEIYKEKLLTLPNFLRPPQMQQGDVGEGEDILTALKMTGHFLEHWAFNHHTQGIPEPRILLEQKFIKQIHLK